MTYDDPMGLLSADFWSHVLQGTVRWAIQALPKVLVVLLLGFVLLKLVNLGCRQLVKRAEREGTERDEREARERKKRAETLIGIVRKASLIAVWILVGMLLLTQVGVNIAPLIAGAGILGLAVGFGAQELVRDVITGFFILLENQVRKGDVAIINGTGGLVESIGLRTISLRDLSGVVHIFQNGKISSLSNMTKEWSAMVFDIGVAYKEDTDEVVGVMREVAANLASDPEFSRKILEPIEIFGVDSFGDNAVVIKARLKTVPIEQWAVGREYRRRLKRAFDEKRIEIPFPHRTLYWGEASEPFRVATSVAQDKARGALPPPRERSSENSANLPRNGGRH